MHKASDDDITKKPSPPPPPPSEEEEEPVNSILQYDSIEAKPSATLKAISSAPGAAALPKTLKPISITPLVSTKKLGSLVPPPEIPTAPLDSTTVGEEILGPAKPERT